MIFFFNRLQDETTIAGLDAALANLAFEQNTVIVIHSRETCLISDKAEGIIREKLVQLSSFGIDKIFTLGGREFLRTMTNIELKEINRDKLDTLLMEHRTILSF